MDTDGLMFKINKIEAAHRQLRIAVRMWFHDEDPVSAHTLAFAAYEVAHFVSKARNPNRPDLLLDSSQIKPDKRKEFNQAFREAANFFKHANRDPEGSIEFSPGLTEVFIYFAALGLQLAGVDFAPEIKAYVMRVQVHMPELLLSKNAHEVIAQRDLVKNVEKLKAMSKSEFFEAFMHGHNQRNVA